MQYRRILFSPTLVTKYVCSIEKPQNLILITSMRTKNFKLSLNAHVAAGHESGTLHRISEIRKGFLLWSRRPLRGPGVLLDGRVLC
ncbi:hypothetical protein CEXT_628671 [Caerostris extrusa]|uniref:Uncharacterized protein n=1 Tax=Caerostris extrusa TaxID=172846 RepID=A0AAV4U6P5_CAEEX|nr:hypothetical protein CEXT_628671 [Caerostris extrusa]